ncbi:GNAT family N-acetyltransferase [Desulfobacterales bacterium HSG16]|nr:GNAT family N-acetyltransferase [Desulfobacterales bacterium HSG16]
MTPIKLKPEYIKPANDFSPEYCFIKDPKQDQVKQILYLYKSQGWWNSKIGDNYSLVRAIIAGSHLFSVAINKKKNEILGMGRAISDGASDAYIQDVMVKNEFREFGIGSMIIQTLVKQLYEEKIGWIGLVAEPGCKPFYSRMGFQPMAGAVPMLHKKI